MAKLPAFQFYPGDWMKDPNLRRCSIQARGVWMDILCIMFEHEPRGVLTDVQDLRKNRARFAQALRESCVDLAEPDLQDLRKFCTPWTVNQLARMIPGADPRTIERYIKELIKNSVIKQLPDGSMYSKRLVKDELVRMERAVAGQKGGKQTQAKRRKKVQAKSSSSSSSSSTNKYIGWFEQSIKPMYPKREGSNPWRAAAQACAARLKQCADVEAEQALMIAGVKRYRHYCQATNKIGTPYILQAKTFFGPDQHYLEKWDVTPQARRQAIKFPAKGDCPGWTAFAAEHGLKPGYAELQVDFERRVRNHVTEMLEH